MEVGSSSALLLEVPAVASAVASAESDQSIELLLPRACEGEGSSLVFLLLLDPLRFLFFASWLALWQCRIPA